MSNTVKRKVVCFECELRLRSIHSDDLRKAMEDFREIARIVRGSDLICIHTNPNLEPIYTQLLDEK